MPVTAKLSRAFYDRFGDEATNELVNWLNAVDESYRSQLRELNEFNFARFEAKLEQRIATSEARLQQQIAALDAKVVQRTAALETKFERRLRTTEIRLAGLTIAWVPVALAIFEFVFRR